MKVRDDSGMDRALVLDLELWEFLLNGGDGKGGRHVEGGAAARCPFSDKPERPVSTHSEIREVLSLKWGPLVTENNDALRVKGDLVPQRSREIDTDELDLGVRGRQELECGLVARESGRNGVDSEGGGRLARIDHLIGLIAAAGSDGKGEGDEGEKAE